ncbi:hypothetical protein D3C85_932940 [compost metagenome]
MAEAVVDVLETVEVEKQHCALAAGVQGAGEGRLQATFEQGAVGQAGERVMVCLVIQLGLGVLEAGNVSEHGHEMRGYPFAVAHGTDGQPTGVELAVLAPVVDFPLPMAFGGQLVPQGDVEGTVMLT